MVSHRPYLSRAWRARLRVGFAVLLVILLVECVAFNLPFWRTRGSSTDSASYVNAMGSGLERTDAGRLRVADPAHAWLEVRADGTSDYLRVDATSVRQDALRTVHLRVSSSSDADGSSFHAERAVTVAPWSARSLFVRSPGEGVKRVWVQEAKGSVIPIRAVRANVRVPFSFSPARVALMAAAALLVAAWRPGSRLWRVRLDTADVRQRWAFAAALAPLAVYTAANVVWQVRFAGALVFHEHGMYTFDFDQYGHVADALIDGHAWLDLEVPDALADAANPYDTGVRASLLADGVTPLYWDYAFYGGRWYSYFGVLPAVLLFVPYRLLTGRMLPTAAAMHVLMFLAVLFTALVTVRLVERLMPRASVGAATVALAFVPLASGFGYLMFRTNFYSVPFAASLTLTMLGLWFWLGAQTDAKPLRARDRWRVGRAPELSLPRLALGSACIAANFGCRPTFCLSALLGFVVFREQIGEVVAALAARRVCPGTALRAPLVVVAAAAVPLVPLMAYNQARFGSVLDFGNAYQFTVTDMTSFRTPAANVLPLIGYYLLLPPRLIPRFPYLALSPTPLPEWAYAEPMIGGMAALCPLLPLAFAAPFLRRRIGRKAWILSCACLALGSFIVAFDAVSAGLGWRYLCDFSWLFAFAALPVLLRLLDREGVTEASMRPAVTGAARAARRRGDVPAAPGRARLAVGRTLILTFMLLSIAVALLSCFVVGRSDQLITGNPALYHDVASWFLA